MAEVNVLHKENLHGAVIRNKGVPARRLNMSSIRYIAPNFCDTAIRYIWVEMTIYIRGAL